MTSQTPFILPTMTGCGWEARMLKLRGFGPGVMAQTGILKHDPEGGPKRNCMYVTNIYRYIHWSDAGCEDFPMKYICGF